MFEKPENKQKKRPGLAHFLRIFSAVNSRYRELTGSGVTKWLEHSTLAVVYSFLSQPDTNNRCETIVILRLLDCAHQTIMSLALSTLPKSRPNAFHYQDGNCYPVVASPILQASQVVAKSNDAGYITNDCRATGMLK